MKISSIELLMNNFLTNSQKRICDKLDIEYDTFEKKLMEQCGFAARFDGIEAGDIVFGLTYRPTGDGVMRWVRE